MDDLAGALSRLGDAGPAAPGGAGTAQPPAATIAGLSSAIGAQGGIDPILDKLRAAGFGEQVDSWISTGANETIPPQQLGAALGDEQVQALSANSGISISSLLPLLAGKRTGWRTSVLIEYWAENAMPWLVGMTYKAVRTDRHKYIRWVNRSRDGELDELYDLERDPYEIANVVGRAAYRATRDKLRRELRRLTVEAAGL